MASFLHQKQENAALLAASVAGLIAIAAVKVKQKRDFADG
jgi:hypothetical protein